MQRIATLLIERARWFVGALAALTLAACLYLFSNGLAFDASLENFFPQEDPLISRYRAFTEEYGSDDGLLLIGFEHPDLFSYPVLRDVSTITDSLDRLPNVDRVVSLTSVEGLRNGPEGIETRRFFEEITDDPEVLGRQRRALLADSQAVGLVVNPEADVTAFAVHIEPESEGYEGREVVLEGVRRVLEPFEAAYDFRITGIPFIRNAYVDSLRVETGKYFVISSLLIILILVWMFRNWRGVVAPLMVVYLGVLWTVAVMMLTGSPIDVLSSTLTAILLVVGVADSIHLLSKYYDALSEKRDRRHAVREMIVRLGAATFLTSITTAIGFVTLASSEVVPMQRFGIFTAIGVLLTFVVSVILLSGFLLWTPLPRRQQTDRLTRGRIRRMLAWIDRFSETHAAAICWTALGVLLISIAGAFQLRVNAFVNDDLGPGTPVYEDMVFFQEEMVAPFPLELLVTSPDADAFKDPGRLRQIERVAAYLDARPEVKRVVSIADVLKSVNRTMTGDSAGAFRLPESQSQVAEYLFLMELTDEESLSRLVDFDYREARISALMDDIGSHRMKAFTADLDSVLAATLDPNLEVTRTGTIVLAMGIAEYLTESLLYSIGLAILFISVLMGVLFRTIRLVAISLIPNLLPLVITAGVMGLLSIDIKPSTAVIFSIALGITVDDSIHMLARLRQEVALGAPVREAIRNTLMGTGKAVILTSLILFGGFAVLVTSSFQSSQYLGLLVSLTIFTALLADLFLLPALLHLWKPDLRPLGRTQSKPTDRPHTVA